MEEIRRSSQHKRDAKGNIITSTPIEKFRKHGRKQYISVFATLIALTFLVTGVLLFNTSRNTGRMSASLAQVERTLDKLANTEDSSEQKELIASIRTTISDAQPKTRQRKTAVSFSQVR